MKSVLMAALAATALTSVAVSQVTIPPHASTYNGFSRGMNFTAAANFIIQDLELPLDAYQAGDEAAYLILVNGNIAHYSRGNVPTAANPGARTSVGSILISTGDVVDVIGNWSPATGQTNFTAHNSYGSSAPYATTIVGTPHTLNRNGWQWDIGDPAWVSTGTTGTLLAATSGSIGRVLMYAVPPAGLFPSFTSDVTTGASPLTVNFSDTSYSSDPAGIVAWAWDLDGDTVIDSTLQNPSFTYTSCGSFDVTLTVVDGLHGPMTVTQTAYITTDMINADFTGQVIGPLVMQFNDTSDMPATSWAWDLDGDSVVDSTVQNPAWVYPNASPVNVTLTVTRLCSAPSTVTKSIVPLQQISQNILPNNGLSSGASVYFDLDVVNPTGINISSLDVAPSVANTAFTVEVFVKPGTYTGFEGTASEWVSAGVGTSAGGPVTTAPSAAVAFAQPLHLPQGLSGIKLWYVGVGPRYQTGSGITTVSNGDLNLTLGTSRGSSTTDPWSGSNITPRWWSGTIYYDTHNVSGFAGYGAFAPGCAGTLGVSHLSGNLPQLGSAFSIGIDNLPLSAAIMLTGFSNTSSVFGPLPADLSSFGAPGCFGRVSTDATLFLVGSGNAATWTFNVPVNPAFSGLLLFSQALVIDPAANALGAVMSDAAAWVIGS